MSLTTCRECREQISTDAKTCPKCGAKQRTHPSFGAYALGALLVLLTVTSCVSSCKSRMDENQRNADAAKASERARVQEESRLSKLRAECAGERTSKLDAYQEALTKREFARAADALRGCAEATGEEALQKLVQGADISELKAAGRNKQTSIRARMAAFERLLEAYPNDYSKDDASAYAALATRTLAEEKARKRSEGVRIGMTEQDVLDSSWGRPTHVNRTTTARGTREQWVYGESRRGYLYFENGILTSVQN